MDVEPEAEGMQPQLDGQARPEAREVMGPQAAPPFEVARGHAHPSGCCPTANVVAAAQQPVVLAARRQRGAGAPQVLHCVAGEGPFCGVYHTIRL